MPRGPRIKSKSGIYHVIQRGVNKQEIFHDDDDFRKYLDILQKYKLKTDLKFYGWCLMSNHVHLLLKEGNETISITMKRIGVSYAAYYNWKYVTTGHLFQGRFKSRNVEHRQSLLKVLRYIHQNPLKAGMVRCMEEWKWSSCLGYYGKQHYQRGMLDEEFILETFASRIEFREFNEIVRDDQRIEEWATERKRLTDEEAREEIKKVLGSIEIAQIKSLPKLKRNQLLQQIKKIEGLSQRQTARILGVSASLIFRV
mgnify:CR=1 FL=1